VARRCVLALTALVLALGWGRAAPAHPHVFVTYQVTARIGADGPSALTFSWAFDAMYSALVTGDYVNEAGPTLSPVDIERLRDKAFANAAKYHYFVEVWLNRKPIEVAEVTGFTAAMRDDRLIYEFTVPLAAPAARGANELVVVVFDPEYYVEFSLAKAHPATVDAADGIAVKCITYTDQDVPSELGPVVRDVVRCTWRR